MRIVITGPTGAGKNALAYQIARARDFTIINADSRQIYREIPIITNQPNAQELALCPHVLYGSVPITDYYSVAQWTQEASVHIAKTENVIVLGGTGMYINALLHGLSDMPSDAGLKLSLFSRLQAEGLATMRAELFSRDPQSAARIQPMDTHRILRAYEVLLLSGKSIFDFFHIKNPPPFSAESFKKFALIPPVEQLYRSIDQRFLQMMDKGALAEAQEVHSKLDGQRLAAAKTAGLSELWRFLSGEMTLDQSIELAQRNTRRYAKRQITWIRNQQKDFQVCESDHEIIDNLDID